MSGLKALVDALRLLSDLELRQLVASRNLSTNYISDFYELAEALNSAKNYSSLIGTLSSKELDQLAKLSREETVEPEKLKSLISQQLVYKTDSGFKVFEPLLQVLKEARAFTRSISIIELDKEEPDQELIDRNCGLNLFETLMALNELVFDLEQHLVREVGKGGVGLPDVKRLSATLGRNNEQVKWLHQLAAELGLTQIRDGRHRLTNLSLDWIWLEPADRTMQLIENFIFALGPAREELQLITPGTHLPSWFAQNYPLAGNHQDSKLSRLVQKAEALGLTFDGHAASWFASTVKIAKVATEHIDHLPKTQSRIIIQADLSIVAPGPLPLSLEAKIRKFAICENIGLASTFRLSELSVSHGLETGIAISEITRTLEEASSNKLPQPVDYLLRQVESKFGRLRISTSEQNDHRSVIDSDDPILLTEIGNDSRLRPYNFTRVYAGRLASRFEPSIIYFGLREAGFLAVRIDEAGNIMSPLSTQLSPNETSDEEESPIDRMIKKLRIADTTQITVLGDEALSRQVQLAIRNKAKLVIEAKLADGSTSKFVLEPSSIANGRLRGKDKKAGIERTLPLTTIVSISLE